MVRSDLVKGAKKINYKFISTPFKHHLPLRDATYLLKSNSILTNAPDAILLPLFHRIINME